ncbi:hypothetical protein REPUB_Repub02eG0279200 [Reevesia pubescens]
MAMDQFVIVGGNGWLGQEAGVVMHSFSSMLWLSMIIFSLSIISMVIFACGDFVGVSAGGGGGGSGGGDCGGDDEGCGGGGGNVAVFSDV